MACMAETDLYGPIKQFLEAQGYQVKGEIGPCDVVAVRSDERAVIVELKERLNLSLILQAANRLTMSDAVYVAFRIGKGHSASWRSQRRHVVNLLRRLGLGLLTVTSRGHVVPVLDPAPYRSRSSHQRRSMLLKEFTERVGDPAVGGSRSAGRVTAYRQDALRCARELAAAGALKISVLSDRTGVSRAGPILRDNHYGWFDRVKVGHYALSTEGKRGLTQWSHALPRLSPLPVARSADHR